MRWFTPLLIAILLSTSSLAAHIPTTDRAPTQAYQLYVRHATLEPHVANATQAWDNATQTRLFHSDGIPLNVSLLDTKLSYQAVASQHPKTGPVTGCSVTINEDVPRDRLDALVMHEVGHCLGLNHRDSGVMRPGIEGFEQVSELEGRVLDALWMRGIGS